MNFELSIEKLLETLPIMAKGMIGIFVVTLVIVAIVYILNAATKGKD